MNKFTNTSTIPYWRLKTFNDKLNASIALLKNYWKPILKANAVISGPFFIIGVGLILFYFNVILQNLVLQATTETGQFINQMIFYFFIGGLLYGLALISVVLVTFEVIRLQKDNPDQMDNLRLIFRNVRKKFWKFIGLLFLTLIALIIGNIILFIVTVIVSLVTLGFGVLLIYPAQLFFYVTLYSFLYILFPLAYFERSSVSRNISKSREFLKSTFWQTAGMYIGTKAIQYVIANGLMIPLFVFLFYFIFRQFDSAGSQMNLLSENQLVFNISMIFLFLYLLVSLATNIFHVITSAVQYLSLKEDLENTYVFQQIEQFETLGE